jgi:hypothetical protein
MREPFPHLESINYELIKNYENRGCLSQSPGGTHTEVAIRRTAKRCA